VSIQERAERKLAAGEWLSTGEAAALLGVNKSTVIRMVKADPPQISAKAKPGIGRYWLIDPAAVATIRGGGGQSPSA
jgi:excisionase family DNA binding protein